MSHPVVSGECSSPAARPAFEPGSPVYCGFEGLAPPLQTGVWAGSLPILAIMKRAGIPNLEKVAAAPINVGWIAEIALLESAPKVLWTPAGAERAMVLMEVLRTFSVRTLSDLAHLDRGCKAELPGHAVGPQVAAFWNQILQELDLRENLDGLYQVLQFVVCSNSR